MSSACSAGFLHNTPEELMAAGLYRKIAIACAPEPHRQISLAQLARACGAKVCLPSTPPLPITRPSKPTIARAFGRSWAQPDPTGRLGRLRMQLRSQWNRGRSMLPTAATASTSDPHDGKEGAKGTNGDPTSSLARIVRGAGALVSPQERADGTIEEDNEEARAAAEMSEATFHSAGESHDDESLASPSISLDLKEVTFETARSDLLPSERSELSAEASSELNNVTSRN